MNKLNIVLIIFSLSILLAKISADPLLTGHTLILSYLLLFLYIILFVFMFLLVLFLLRLAVNASKFSHKAFLFLIAFTIACLFITFIAFQPDDEMFLSYFAYSSLTHGANPYTVNYLQPLLSNLSDAGSYGTIMSNGTIVSTYNYPVLYMLLQAPFFAIAGSPQALGYIAMPLEYMAFFGFFLFVYYFVLKEKKGEFPVYSAVILASIAFIVFSSTIILVMLALMLVMYTRWGQKPANAGIALGLMASLQTQLWPFVIIFMLYKFRNEDRWKWWNIVLVAGGVFLIINGVFILANYHTFFGNLISAGSLLPDWIAPIGSIIVILGLPSIIAEAGFLLSTLYMGWISGREEPKWIMLMSSIPFLFLTHALPIYFVLGFAGYALVQDGNYG